MNYPLYYNKPSLFKNVVIGTKIKNLIVADDELIDQNIMVT